MSFTAAAVRRLVNIDPSVVSDSEIEAYADDGYTAAIDVAIALCDYMASIDSSATSRIKVGPISIDRAQSSSNWQSIKDNLIKRRNYGEGGSSIGGASLTFFGGATQTGSTESQVTTGMFDNPPEPDNE